MNAQARSFSFLEEYFIRDAIDVEPYLGPLADLRALAADIDEGLCYRESSIVIRGKRRDFCVLVDERLREAQNRVLYFVDPLIQEVADSAHGYLRGRSIRSNATLHAGHQWQQRLDISDFFRSIKRHHIDEALASAGLIEEARGLVIGLVMYRGSLPLGAVTSPALSNLVVADLDQQLEALASLNGLAYTRYADDLTFSGPDPFDVEESVAAILKQRDFALNAAKSKLRRYGQRQYVTGLATSVDTPRVRPDLKRKLRQQFYFISKYGLDSHSEVLDEDPERLAQTLSGQLAFINSIEPDWVSSLASAFPLAARSIGYSVNEERSSKRARVLETLAASVRARESNTLEYSQ